jgi:hypothetical protein
MTRCPDSARERRWLNSLNAADSNVVIGKKADELV